MNWGTIAAIVMSIVALGISLRRILSENPTREGLIIETESKVCLH